MNMHWSEFLAFLSVLLPLTLVWFFFHSASVTKTLHKAGKLFEEAKYEECLPLYLREENSLALTKEQKLGIIAVLGSIYFHLDRPEEAKKYFKKVIAHTKNKILKAEAITNLMATLMKETPVNLDECKQYCSEFEVLFNELKEQITPAARPVYMAAMGHTSLAVGQYEQALTYLCALLKEPALESKEKYEAFAGIIDIHTLKRDFPAVVSNSEALLALSDCPPHILNGMKINYSYALHQLKRHQDALDSLKTLLEDPALSSDTRLLALNNMASYLIYIDPPRHFEEARQYLSQAIAVNRENIQSKLVEACLDTLSDNPVEGVNKLETLMPDENTATLEAILAYGYSRLCQEEKSSEYFKKSESQDPNNPGLELIRNLSN